MFLTLEEVKTYLWISWTDQDDFLNELISWSQWLVEDHLNRKIEADDYEDKYDGNWRRDITLKQYPINTLTSFQYNIWTLGTPVREDFDTENYAIDSASGIIQTDFGITRGKQNIKVVYNAWYIHTEVPDVDDRPEGLKQVMKQFIGLLYNTPDGIKSENVDWTGIQYIDLWTVDIPANIKMSLNAYKSYNV